jgi:DNA-binding LacI/PurR family transcriptional regulator
MNASIKDLQFKNERIYEDIRNNIITGTYPVGMKFPAELLFARELNVGKITLRTAFERLEKEGLIVRMCSRGTFVAGNKEKVIGKIAVITDYMTAPGSPNPYLLSLIIQEAARRNIEIEQIERFYIEHLPLKTIEKLFRDKGFDGIILMTSAFNGNEPIIKKIHAAKLPVVLPHGSMGDSIITGFASVCVNEREAFYKTLKTALEFGFKKIAVVARAADIPKDNIRSVAIPEIKDLLREKLHSINYFECEPADMEKALAKLLKKANRPDIFICYSDFVAILLSVAMKHMNLRIPGDFSVMGFSGLPSNLPLAPDLTGIKYQYSKIIGMAFDLLITKNKWFDAENQKTAPSCFCDYEFSQGITVSIRPIK